MSSLNVGRELWIPCEVRPGPFSNEHRVYLKIGNTEWFGFVDESELQEGRVRAKIIAIKPNSIILGIRAISPAGRTIAAAPETIERLRPVAA